MITFKVNELSNTEIIHNLDLDNMEMSYTKRFSQLNIDVKDSDISSDDICVFNVYANNIEEPIGIAIYIMSKLKYIIDVIDFETITINSDRTITVVDCCSVTTINMVNDDIRCV